MVKVVLSLGTNIDSREYYMQRMVDLTKEILKPPVKLSAIMETEPIGVKKGQIWFYNRIISGFFGNTLKSLLYKTQKIESELGRTGKRNLMPRTADIDILLFGSCIINEKDIIIPHSQILDRRFCIEGIIEIEPDLIHPVENKKFCNLYKNIKKEITEQKIHYISKKAPVIRPFN